MALWHAAARPAALAARTAPWPAARSAVLAVLAALLCCGGGGALVVTLGASTNEWRVLDDDGVSLLESAGGTWICLDGVVHHAHASAQPGALLDRRGGQDELGRYDSYETRWRVDEAPAFVTTIKHYPALDAVVFGLRLTREAANSTLGVPGAAGHLRRASRYTSSAFPRVAFGLAEPQGVLEFAGPFLEASTAMPLPRFLGRSDVQGGARWSGGPYVAFSGGGSDHKVVISALAAPLVSSCLPAQQNRGGAGPGGRSLECGLMGSVLRAGDGAAAVSFVASFSTGSVAGAMRKWGATLRRAQGLASARLPDPTLRQLGYGTQNGAFYYYHADAGRTMAQQLVAVGAALAEAGVPARYALLDSWWYHTDAKRGLTLWEPRADVFPGGIGALREATGWYFQMHGRYFSSETPYRQRYAFAAEPEGAGPTAPGVQDGYDPTNGASMAVPLEGRFWRDLLGAAREEWGLRVYEQDWLWNTFERMNFTLGTFGGAARWLRALDEGALATGTAVQLCMALPRQLLFAAGMRSVTQARASDDYHPGMADRCNFPFCVHYIGTSSLLLHALGIAPSKDTYWSSASADNCCNPRYCEARLPPPPDPTQSCNAKGPRTERFAELHAVVAAYSTGPNAPSDKAGVANASLVRMACRPDGLLLRPSSPMLAIDKSIYGAAFGAAAAAAAGGAFARARGDAHGQRHQLPIMASASSILVQHRGDAAARAEWHHVLAVNLESGVRLSPEDIGADAAAAPWVLWRGHDHRVPARAGAVQLLGTLSEAAPLAVEPCGLRDFRLLHAAPVIGGVALLGEVAKWVPVSADRIEVLRVVGAAGDALAAVVRGAPGEAVELAFAVGSEVAMLLCTVPDSGTVAFVAGAGAAPQCQSPEYR